MNVEDLSFEEAYNELERVVQQLEEGADTLEEAVRLYEWGTALSSYCAILLEQAELRVSQLREREDGNLDEEPFEWDG
jgi:exodeoxyribonuclease VII small subunit